MLNARFPVPVEEPPAIQNQVRKFHRIILISSQPFVSKKRIYLKTNLVITIGPCSNQHLSNTHSLAIILLVTPRCKEKPHNHSPLAERAMPPALDVSGLPKELPSVMEIKAPLRRISFRYQLGQLQEHEQRSSRMYSTDSSKSYGLKQIRGGPLSMIHVGNKKSSS